MSYQGRRFSPAGTSPDRPVAHYQQDGDVLWGEFTGGDVLRGSLAGTVAADGSVDFAYCMIRRGGERVTGLCHSVPGILPDGRLRLTEHWQRFSPVASSGVSYLDELPDRWRA